MAESTRRLTPRATVVEFGAGTGHVAIVLAARHPQCAFVLVDKKRRSLDIAEERIQRAKLNNITVLCGAIEEYAAPFDLGLALHACGEATDLALEKCINCKAAYVMAPCCVGKIKHSSLKYPRSARFQQLVTREEYQVGLFAPTKGVV